VKTAEKVVEKKATTRQSDRQLNSDGQILERQLGIWQAKFLADYP